LRIRTRRRRTRPRSDRDRTSRQALIDYGSRGSYVLACLMLPPPYQALGGSVTELRVSASVEAGGMAQGSANLALIGCQLRGSTFTTLIWKRISPQCSQRAKGWETHDAAADNPSWRSSHRVRAGLSRAWPLPCPSHLRTCLPFRRCRRAVGSVPNRSISSRLCSERRHFKLKPKAGPKSQLGAWGNAWRLIFFPPID